MKQFKTIRDLIDASVTQQEINERETIASIKLKGDISYKDLGKFGDNEIQLMIVNGQRRGVVIREPNKTALILTIDQFKDMQKVMKRIRI
tara:strand:- start:636 stop:905 length:270 start_codon:yes stop_codon:yes gene_type:complete